MTSGFTIVRNAEILDYPLTESVCSALPLCDEFIISCGDSRDNTLGICNALQADHPDKIRLNFVEWDEKQQRGGYQLQHHTNEALKECRGNWCLYLQADEVIHEEDYALIQTAQNRAGELSAVDGIVFEYEHFYGNYSFTIQGRNWYRREVRLFKNGRSIQAFRDAQGFRREGKRLRAISSGARIFHYGYVRTVQTMEAKAIEMARWWGNSPQLSAASLIPRRHFGLRRYNETHPSQMSSRIGRSSGLCDPSQSRRVWNTDEIKNCVTFCWESVFRFRIGEFRNYELVAGGKFLPK